MVSIEHEMSSRFEHARIEITKIIIHPYGAKRETENGIILGIHHMSRAVRQRGINR